LGTLAIAAALSVLYMAVHSSVHVQLLTATAGALLGMLAVRNRHSPAFEVDEPAVLYRKPLRNDTSRLAVVGDAMLQKTRTKNRPLSIVVFDFSDLPELQIVYQGQVPRDLGPTIGEKLRGVAPAKGAVVRTGPTTFTVLLPNFDTRKTLRAVYGAFGKACCLEFAQGGSEMLLLPDFAVKTVRGGTESVEDVYQVLYGDLLEAQRHKVRRQLSLRREREWHTRPMMLSSTEAAQIRKARHPDVASMAPTMPGCLLPA
jgi:GGDEF domain-containing protein